MSISHLELCERTAKKFGEHVTLVDYQTAVTAEQPDVLTWRHRISTLYEIKVSRNDFLRDKKKPFRNNGKGVGCKRYYVCPAGVIKVEDLPPDWGLYWYNVRGFTLKRKSGFFETNKGNEMVLLTTAIVHLANGRCPGIQVVKRQYSPIGAQTIDIDIYPKNATYCGSCRFVRDERCILFDDGLSNGVHGKPMRCNACRRKIQKFAEALSE